MHPQTYLPQVLLAHKFLQTFRVKCSASNFTLYSLTISFISSPRLTWRDVQHIVVWTSNWEPLKHDQDWSPNGVGLHVNRKFGFGLLVAEKIVELAKPHNFQTVPEKTICRGQINQDRK